MSGRLGGASKRGRRAKWLQRLVPMRWRFWRFWTTSDFLEAGERARQEHAAWLTRAMASGRAYPKIPVKPADAGGFDRLVNKPGGEELAAAWWEAAFNRVDRIEEQTKRRG